MGLISSAFRRLRGAPKERHWTVLYYGAANNNLSRDLGMEMGALRNAGGTDQVDIVAQLSQDGQTRRGRMARFSRFGAINPEFIEEQKAISSDSGDPKNLADFLRWGMQKYPAKNYLVVLSGHGAGHRGMLSDEHHDSSMTTPQLRQALEAAPEKVDVLLLESCQMAGVEVGYELKDVADFMVASQDTTKGNHDLYSTAKELGKQVRKGEVAPRQLVDLLMENTLEPRAKSGVTTACALDLSMMPALGVAVRQLHQSLDEVEPELLHQLAGETPGVRPDREAESSDDIVTRVLEGKRQQYRDARTFVRTLAGDPRVADAEVRQAAQGVSQVLDRAVIAQRSGPDYSEQTGLSWNLSADPTISAGSAYQELKFAQDTGWTGSF